MNRGAHNLGLHPVGLPLRHAFEAIRGTSRHVDLDRHGLAADQFLEPAQLVEHVGKSCDHFRAISGTPGDGNGRRRRGWGRKQPGWE
jgi:hypothetical protein